MGTTSAVHQLQRRINEIRVKNAQIKRFVPERELYDVITQSVVETIVYEITPPYYRSEVVTFVLEGARKVFAVLVTIDHAGMINSFIAHDQLQTRNVDDLLPFGEDTLKAVLGDEYIAKLFDEKQWEFSAPVFTAGKLMPRTLDKETILPYTNEEHLAGGAFGTVYTIKIHPSHKPLGFPDDALVSELSVRSVRLLILSSSLGKSSNLVTIPLKMRYGSYVLFRD